MLSVDMKFRASCVGSFAFALFAMQALAQSSALDVLQKSGELHLSTQSSDICGGVIHQHDMAPCTSTPYRDYVSVKKQSDGSYSVEAEKRYAHVSYDPESKKGYVAPFYCVFGGNGKLSGNDLLLMQNEAQDGKAVQGLRIVFERSSVMLVDENPVENTRYCGFFDSFDGLVFSFPQEQKHADAQ